MNAHFVMQSKGGIGKSLVSNYLAQYLKERENVVCFDIDPSNKTFASYKSLGVIPFGIMSGDDVDKGKFDNLLEEIFQDKINDSCIIDSGSSAFTSMTSYINKENVFDTLKEYEIEPYVHAIITGGKSYTETEEGFSWLVERYGDKTKFIIWKNEYWGKVVDQENIEFENTPVYKEYKDLVYGIITIPELYNSELDKNIESMLKKGQTFDEFNNDSERMIMEKSRVFRFKKLVFNNISLVL